MREKDHRTGVIFVRHGKVDFPHDRLYCDDREDPELTSDGHAQARHAAELIAGQEVAAIYASPMQRARSTAAPIVAATEAPFHIHDGLRERPFGIWDGLYFDQIARDYPDDFRAWKQNPIEFVPEGGEPISEHMRRVRGALDDILAAHAGGLIVVVAHVGPIRMCLTDAMSMPIAAYRQLIIDYGSLSRIDYGREQNNLVYMNHYDRRRKSS